MDTPPKTTGKLHVIVPWKESSRFPGKNLLLYGSTASHVMENVASWAGAVRAGSVAVVLLVGRNGDAPKVPSASCLCDGAVSHIVDMEPGWEQLDVVNKYLADVGADPMDIVAVLQCTQPVRRDMLVYDALLTMYSSEGRKDLVTSFVEWEDDRWRTIRGNGLEGRQEREYRPCMYYDGAVSVWRAGNVRHISKFSPDRVAWVYNYTGPVVDIDYAWQLDGLASLSGITNNTKSK